MRLKPIVISFGLLALLSERAVALDNIDRAIVKCRTNASSTTEHVTCLETALRALGGGNTGEADWVGKASVPSQIQVPQAQAPQKNYKSEVRSEVKAESATVASTAINREVEAQGLGAEQVSVNRRAKAKLREESRVADFAYTQDKSMVIVLNNGQVWKQNGSDLNFVRLNKGGTPNVIVRSGAFSGYRMEFPKQKKTITVSRIQQILVIKNQT